jgi:SET domain-containing protein
VVRSRVILRAIKRIKPGDEITYDYGEQYFDTVIRPIGCKCEKCREKRREWQRKYRRRVKRRLLAAKARRRKAKKRPRG